MGVSCCRRLQAWLWRPQKAARPQWLRSWARLRSWGSGQRFSRGRGRLLSMLTLTGTLTPQEGIVRATASVFLQTALAQFRSSPAQLLSPLAPI